MTTPYDLWLYWLIFVCKYVPKKLSMLWRNDCAVWDVKFAIALYIVSVDEMKAVTLKILKYTAVDDGC